MAESTLVNQLVRAGFTPDLAETYVTALRAGPSQLTAEQADALVAGALAERTPGGAVNIFAPDATIGQRAYQLETHARALREAEPQLEALFRASWEERDPAIQFLRTTEAARAAFTAIQEAARHQVKALDRAPYVSATGPAPPQAEFDALGAGVPYQVIYAANVLDDEGTRAHAYTAIAAGEQARVLGEVPMKMMLVDDVVGLAARVLPEQRIESFLIRPSLLLDTLHSFFDTLWQLAIPIQPTQAADDSAEEGLMVLRGLAAGLTDDAIARELGISERTVARRIARLQETFATRSRFQLGMQAARRGLL